MHTRHFLLFVLERENEDAGLKAEPSHGLRMGFRLYLRELNASARFVAVAKRQTGVEKLSLADVAAEIKPALERHFARRGAS